MLINNLSAKNALVVSCVEDATKFAGLRAEWDALQATSVESSVFMSWAWHFTWWTVFGGQVNQLCILCVRDKHQLVAVLPLYVRNNAWPHRSQVMFLGTGEGETDEVATEYLDILVNPKYVHSATEQTLSFLKSHFRKKRLVLQHMLNDSVLVEALRNKRSPWTTKERDVGYRYRIDLQQHTESIPMQASRVKRVKRSLRAVERDGGFSQVSISSITEAAITLEDVCFLSNQRQSHLGRGKSAFESPRFNEFHHRLLPLLYQTCAADVHNFFKDRELVASLYCFYDKFSCHYYQSGFDQSFANRYMPLTVAHLMEIERNRAAGRRYYDFMRGDANSYKNDFICELTPMFNLVCFPSVADRWLHETATIVRQRLLVQIRRLGLLRRR